MEGSRGRADNSRTAVPLPPKAPDPCPSRPANGGTDNRQKRAGRRQFQLLNPEGPEDPHEERTSAQGKKKPEGRKRILALAKKRLQKLPLRRRPNLTSHNLILSKKLIAIPRKKVGRRSLTNSGFPPQDMCVNSDIAN